MENKYSVSDWQNDHVTLSERGKYVLKSGLWSDCKFFVGSDTHCKVRGKCKCMKSLFYSRETLSELFEYKQYHQEPSELH